jgi:hypothetical protein
MGRDISNQIEIFAFSVRVDPVLRIFFLRNSVAEFQCKCHLRDLVVTSLSSRVPEPTGRSEKRVKARLLAKLDMRS